MTKAKASVTKHRTAWGRYLLVFFVAAWMFVLGVLVGRGTAPVTFDTQELQKELAGLRNAMVQKEREAVERAMRGEDPKKPLEFYKALKTDEPDAAIAIPEPEVTQPPKAARPEPSATVQEHDKAASPPHKNKAAVMAKPAAGAPQPTPPPPKPKPSPPPSPRTPAPTKGQFTIQVASMKDGAAAERIVANLKKDGYSAYLSRIVIPGKGLWFRVRVGSYPDRKKAASDMQRLVQSRQSPILVKNK